MKEIKNRSNFYAASIARCGKICIWELINIKMYKPNEFAEMLGVLGNGQKDDLKNQVEFLRQFANARGIVVDEVIEDIGSGLNYNRKKWNRLLEDSMKEI